MRRLEEALHDLAEQDDRLPASELIARIESSLYGDADFTSAAMDGRLAMNTAENTRRAQRRRWVPMVAAAGAALVVLIAVGLPILFFAGGDSVVVDQPTTTVALTSTTVPPTSVASTTSTSTTTTAVPGITDATETVLAGLLHRLNDTYLYYTSPPEEDFPTDWVTIGELEDAELGFAPIVVELLDTMETVSANLNTLSDAGGLYDFEEGVDALVVAIDDWLVALRWYHGPDHNCFPLLSNEARDLKISELWNQTEWADCMYASHTTEDMEAMRQASGQVEELLDLLISGLGGGESAPPEPAAYAVSLSFFNDEEPGLSTSCDAATSIRMFGTAGLGTLSLRDTDTPAEGPRIHVRAPEVGWERDYPIPLAGIGFDECHGPSVYGDTEGHPFADDGGALEITTDDDAGTVDFLWHFDFYIYAEDLGVKKPRWVPTIREHYTMSTTASYDPATGLVQGSFPVSWYGQEDRDIPHNYDPFEPVDGTDMTFYLEIAPLD